MQNCPSCNTLLPTNSVFFYCPNCPQQIRCKRCHEVLLSSAQRCVMCGTPAGESEQNGSKVASGNGFIAAINTLRFVETGRGYSRKLEVSLTNEVGTSWDGAVIAAIVSGQAPSGKSAIARAGIRPATQDSPIQLSLLNDEASSENNSLTIDTVAQPATVQQADAEKLRHIFRHNGEQLQLMETRLKASNKLDAARRLTYLVLLYSVEVDQRQEMPRTDLNDLLKRVGLYDNNTAHWISKSADLIVEQDRVGLRLSGQEQARKILTEVLDRSIEDKWNLTPGASSRHSKSTAKSDEDSELSTKNGKRKRSGFSKDVEAWVMDWKQFALTLNIQPMINNLNVKEKGYFALWAIGKATNNPDLPVSSYKLKQFLYLGLGIKVDDRNLERVLQAASGQGSLIKVQNGFQLLSSGCALVERSINFTQETAPTDRGYESSSEV